MDFLFEVKHPVFTVKYFIYIISIFDKNQESIDMNLFEYFILNTLNQAFKLNRRYTKF